MIVNLWVRIMIVNCGLAWQKNRIVNLCLWIVSCGLGIVNCELWVCEFVIVNLFVWIVIVNCELTRQKNRIVNLCLWIVSCGLVIVNCQLWIVSFWICACKFECELWLLIVNLRGQKTKLWTCAWGLWVVSLWVVNYCEFRDMVIAYKSLDNMFS